MDERIYKVFICISFKVYGLSYYHELKRAER